MPQNVNLPFWQNNNPILSDRVLANSFHLTPRKKKKSLKYDPNPLDSKKVPNYTQVTAQVDDMNPSNTSTSEYVFIALGRSNNVPPGPAIGKECKHNISNNTWAFHLNPRASAGPFGKTFQLVHHTEFFCLLTGYAESYKTCLPS